jgi:hypothetical protein
MSKNIVNSVYALTDGSIGNISDTNSVSFDIENGYIGVHNSNPTNVIDINGSLNCKGIKIGNRNLITLPPFNTERLELDVVSISNDLYNLGSTKRQYSNAYIID